MVEARIKSIIQFGGFLSTAKPGDRVVYHTGLLMDDRQTTDKVGSNEIERARALDFLADHVAIAADAGLVMLTQRPCVREGVKDYLATRTKRKGSLT